MSNAADTIPVLGSKRGREDEEVPDQVVTGEINGQEMNIPVQDLAAIADAAGIAAGDVSDLGGGRRRRHKLKGGVGACSDKSRTIIKGLVLSSIGVSGYLGGPAVAATLGGMISAGLSWIASAKCTIGYPGGIETALCTKYGELLTGTSTIIATITGNAALGGVTIAGLGSAAVYTAKGAVSKTKELIVATGTKSNEAVDKIVDVICTMLFGSEEDKKKIKNDFGVQTDLPEPEKKKVEAAAAATKNIETEIAPKLPAGQQPITAFMKAKAPKGEDKKTKAAGGRRRKTKKSVRRPRRQTRRQALKFVY